jgi:hypothetical protein
MPFGEQRTRDGDDFICGVERTGSEEHVCQIRLCLEEYLNDVSMLRTRREGAFFVMISEDVSVLEVQVLLMVSKVMYVKHSLV